MGVVPKWENLNAMQGVQARDFKSIIATISMKLSKLCIFKIAFSCGNYSIKVFNPNDALILTEEVTIAPQRMLQENTSCCVLRRR
jgi:Cu2+-exporting ATPase